MKLSLVIYTPRGGLLFVVVLVMCCAILAHISAMDETQVGQRRGDEQNFNGASADGTETGKLKQRERRRSTNNATPNLSDIEKRLKAIMEDRFNKSASLIEKRFQELEKRLDALLRVSPRPRDLYAPLMAYLLGPRGKNTGNQMKGPPGPPGKPGPAGRPGRAGKTGPTGKRGPAGNSGQKGETGPAGAKGESGKPGTNKPVPGSPGPKGEQEAIGRTGAQGPQGAKGEKGQSGVKYVRWGRTTCPSGAQIVYKGITGGEWYAHHGGGANYLCLPHNPKYEKYKNGYQSAGYIYGTEYQVHQYSGDPFKRGLHDHEAPCVVCFVKSRGSVLMRPARNDCPSGWTEEYHGYLMTAYAGQAHSSDFVCVDKDPEYVPGSHANKDGALLYPVEGRCGSLPCLPYVEGRELTCAVCTK